MKVQGLQSSGATQILVSSDGFTSAVIDVQLFPSSFVLTGPNNATGSLTVSQGTSAGLTVTAYRL